jgi:hypothetical protein
MTRTAWAILVFVLLVLSVFPRLAHACSCGRVPWQQQVALSDVIFVGRVLEARSLAYVVLEVREKFKGRVDSPVRIPTGETDCDYFLPPVVAQSGMEFLIYARGRDGAVRVDRCLGSGPVGSKADELARLRRANSMFDRSLSRGGC